MSTQPTDFSQFQIPAVTQRLIDAMKTQARTENQAAVTNFTNRYNAYLQSKLWAQGMGQPIPPAPEPPQMLVVNEDYIKGLEADTSTEPMGTIYTKIAYVPILPPATPAHPDLVINEAGDQDAPGLFNAMPGTDGPWIPIGQAHPQNGKEFTKIPISRSAFAPGGWVTKWQQTK
jgi:hypothetical protein